MEKRLKKQIQEFLEPWKKAAEERERRKKLDAALEDQAYRRRRTNRERVNEDIDSTTTERSSTIDAPKPVTECEHQFSLGSCDFCNEEETVNNLHDEDCPNKSAPCHSRPEGWEEEFSEEFPGILRDDRDFGNYDARKYIKNFIRQTIEKDRASYRTRLRKKVEGMKIDAKGAERFAVERGWIDSEPRAYNSALTDIIQIIDEGASHTDTSA